MYHLFLSSDIGKNDLGEDASDWHSLWSKIAISLPENRKRILLLEAFCLLHFATPLKGVTLCVMRLIIKCLFPPRAIILSLPSWKKKANHAHDRKNTNMCELSERAREGPSKTCMPKRPKVARVTKRNRYLHCCCTLLRVVINFETPCMWFMIFSCFVSYFAN